MLNQKGKTVILSGLMEWSELTIQDLAKVSDEDLESLDAIDLNWCYENNMSDWDKDDEDMSEETRSNINSAIVSHYEELGYSF